MGPSSLSFGTTIAVVAFALENEFEHGFYPWKYNSSYVGYRHCNPVERCNSAAPLAVFHSSFSIRRGPTPDARQRHTRFGTLRLRKQGSSPSFPTKGGNRARAEKVSALLPFLTLAEFASPLSPRYRKLMITEG